MRNSNLIVIASLFLLCSLNAAPIPADKCIPAKIVAHLAVSPPQQAMLMPTDVAVDSHGTVFVADGVNNRIVRFASNGASLPPLLPALNQPVGLFIDHDDRLWVADTGNHRVLKLRDDGTIDQTFDLPPAKDQPAKPTDLVLTEGPSRIYVIDNANHRVLMRDLKSTQWTTLGESGKSLGQFQYPFMIAADAQGYVYLTEAIGARVQAIAPSNRWAGEISGFGVEMGQVYRPKGIAIDAKGYVYISDSTLGVVQVFRSEGAFLGILTDAQHRPLRFEHPMGMSFDARGRLYVVELKANRVAVLSLAESGDQTP